MPSYGYKFFTFAVHKRGDKSHGLPLGELHGPGAAAQGTSTSQTDAAVLLYGLLNGIRDRRIDEKTKHLTVKTIAPVGRAIRFTIDLGTSGLTSTFVDPSARSGAPVFTRVDRHIETNQRRGLIVAPTHATLGMLALESRGGATGSSQLGPLLKRGVAAHTGLIIDFDAVVHEGALEKFLEEAQVGAVQLKRKGLPSDIADSLDVRQKEAHLGNLEMTISKGGIPALARGLTDKFRRDDVARRQLLSVGGLDFDDLNIKVQVGQRKTTLSISADRMPSFVYELRSSNGVPSEEYFYSEVEQMVPEVGAAFGVTVGASWKTGAWSDTSRATKVELPRQEASVAMEAGGIE